MSTRFTIDGSDALEARLARLCEQVLQGIRSLVPARKLEALVLGGGYGRGQGGVLKTETGDQPYNDLEFYLFLRGHPLLNERRFGAALRELAHRLSPAAGLHLEFKIDSLEKLRRGPVSMFSYDLVARHRLLLGDESLFRDCPQHLDPAAIPLSEATRLLFNRCTGLLLAKELLQNVEAGFQPASEGGILPPGQSDFIGRNLAKAQLALGDVVLTAAGQYHWSCLERHRRLSRVAALLADNQLPALGQELLAHHAAGVDFKLHPRRILKPADEFQKEHRAISDFASQLWLWLESRRLNRTFASLRDYACSGVPKCSGVPLWRNYLLNLKTFGPKAALGSLARRYPRERLFNTLPLLLWNGEAAQDTDVLRHLQTQLQTRASTWSALVAAYKKIWPSFG